MKSHFVCFVLLIVSVACAVGYSDPTKAPFCNPTCPSEYDSICAANGTCLKIFNNQCFLEAYNCRARFDVPFKEVDFSYCNELKHKFCF